MPAVKTLNASSWTSTFMRLPPAQRAVILAHGLGYALEKVADVMSTTAGKVSGIRDFRYARCAGETLG